MSVDDSDKQAGGNLQRTGLSRHVHVTLVRRVAHFGGTDGKHRVPGGRVDKHVPDLERLDELAALVVVHVLSVTEPSDKTQPQTPNFSQCETTS